MNRYRHSALASAQNRRTKRVARSSDPGYRWLFETAREGILILAADTGRILEANPALTALAGLSRSEIAGKTFGELGLFKDLLPDGVMLQLLENEGQFRCEDLPLEARDGRKLFVELVVSLHQAGDKKQIHCIVRDITERKRAENELRRLHAELERNVRERAAQRREYRRKFQALSRRLVEAQEIERRNIARELHDEIGQSLTILQLNLQAMLPSADTSALKSRLSDNLKVIDQLMDQVQDIALNLRPSMLDDFGLEPALVWLTSRQAALAGIRGSVRAGGLKHRLDAVIETACYRIAQEALTNVVRHARARAVAVDVHAEDDQLHLRIRDDGVGFDVSAVREKAVRGASLGLLSMEERAALAGGGLELTSRCNEGTEVHAWFPLRRQTAKT